MPVIIIGGGPVGLLTSIALSHCGIEHSLFERHPRTSIHPKAVGLNIRTLEIFRSLGLEEPITAAAAPAHAHSKTAWYTDLGEHRRQILTRDAWGGGKYKPEYDSFSPCRITVLPQIRLEPILLQRARELNPTGVVFGAEVVDVNETGKGVVVSVKHAGDDGVRTYEADYAVAADGGRTVGTKLGIEMSGEKDVMAMASAHIRAPLSRCHPDPDVLITWFIDPAKGGSINTGYLYHLGPYNGNLDEEEWMFACAMDPNGPRFGREEMLRRLQETLKLPQEVGVRVDLLSVSHWAVNAVVADRFRSPGGRVFLVGDAAHRIPPWGALGLNTGVQDVQNLAWKLAFSIRNHHIGENHEPNNLLNTYEEERRPIALRVAQTSLSNLRNHALAMDRALGIDPGQPVEESIASFNAYFDEAHSAHQRIRDAVSAAQKVLDSEFHAPGGETGWFYKSANIHNEDHGGQITETGEFDIYTYHPTTTPGHHMPHFWIAKNGVRKSVRDLLRRDKFVLLARSARWEVYKSEVDEIHTEILDGKDSNWRDEENRWGSLPGLDENQALLVRPDGIIAWRMHRVGSLSTEDYAKICMREILRYLSA